MKNKAYDIAAYSFSKGESFLLDANIWLYLFPAPSDFIPRFAITYSAALKKMMSAGAEIVLDVLILSEYLNSYCRIEWRALHKSTYPIFKAFRKSVDFAAVAQGATLFAQRILDLSSRYDHPFDGANLTQILADFQSGVYDLNDGLLVETCRHHGWKLITNDGDFTTGGIEVVTGNPGLLKACP